MIVELTEQECEILHAIFYGVVGGSNRGPREIVEQMATKLPRNHHTYTANIETINRMGSQAVVIRKS